MIQTLASDSKMELTFVYWFRPNLAGTTNKNTFAQTIVPIACFMTPGMTIPFANNNRNNTMICNTKTPEKVGDTFYQDQKPYELYYHLIVPFLRASLRV